MGSIGKELFLLSFYSIHPATVGVARLSRASLAPTDQAFFRGNRWASQAQRQPTGLRQLRGAEIRRALCRPEREAGCREQAAGMRRESALAQGCAIADAPGSLPVSEDSGGSGRQGRGLRGHGLMPPLPPPPSGRLADRRSRQRAERTQSNQVNQLNRSGPPSTGSGQTDRGRGKRWASQAQRQPTRAELPAGAKAARSARPTRSAKSWRPPPPQGYNSPPAPSGGAILT